jgi:hypothetical protein
MLYVVFVNILKDYGMHQSLVELAILHIQQGVCQSKSFCRGSVSGITVELMLLVPIIVGKNCCWFQP